MAKSALEHEALDLVRRMAARDPKALEALYDRYHRLVFTLVLRIVRVREDAEDIVVDVFWQVWQQSSRYDETRGKPLSWLLTIARTRAIDALRSSNRHPSLASAVEKGESPEDPAITADMRDAVRKALQSLPEQQRVPLELAYFEGMTHSEIAASLNQPLGTMKDRIRNGMSHLRKQLKAYL